MSLTEQLQQYRLIPVITLTQAQDILPLAQLLLQHDLPVAEITLRSEAALQGIKLLRQHYPSMLIGAGTVLNGQQAAAAQQAGANFVVAPGFNPNTVRACQTQGITIIPGVNNPSTIEAALEMGLETLKFFPAQASGGVAMVKALLAPYPQIKLMPTGGISADNLRDYLAIDGVIACGGSWFAEQTLIQAQRWDLLSIKIQAARQLLA